MFGRDEIRRAETAFGFCYPAEFLAALPELQNLISNPAFAIKFPQAHLLPPGDLAAAWASHCPKNLVPFIYCGTPDAGDYYCFQKCQSGPGSPIEVFADHAVVHQWEDYDAFLKWVTMELEKA